jgi:hypothetical protein
MVRLMFFLHRAPHLSRAEFSRYWLEKHAAIVAGVAPRRGMRRYCQLHATDHPLQRAIQADRQTMQAEFDGIAEVTFDGIDDVGGGDDLNVYDALLKEDEKQFIDMARSMVMIVDEHEIDLSAGA